MHSNEWCDAIRCAEWCNDLMHWWCGQMNCATPSNALNDAMMQSIDAAAEWMARCYQIRWMMQWCDALMMRPNIWCDANRCTEWCNDVMHWWCGRMNGATPSEALNDAMMRHIDDAAKWMVRCHQMCWMMQWCDALMMCPYKLCDTIRCAEWCNDVMHWWCDQMNDVTPSDVLNNVMMHWWCGQSFNKLCTSETLT